MMFFQMALDELRFQGMGIKNWVKEMGYITVTPKKIEHSYYKLKDGTIIKTLIHINHLTPNPKSPEGFTVNSQNIVVVYVPKENRNPMAFQPFNPAEIQNNISDDDMEPEPLRENVSVYDLSNGMVLSVKAVAGQIRKTKFYTQDGEPIYAVNTTPIIKVKKNQQ